LITSTSLTFQALSILV